MDMDFDLSAADAVGGVDPAALRFRQWQHGRRLLAEIEEVRAAESELAARRFRLVAELARDYPAPIEFARNDIAPALHITDIDADQLLERAATFTTVLPETLAALTAGRIGEAQATAVADAVADTTPEVAAVVDRFAVAAMDNEPLTDRQVYRRAHRQVLKLDPPAAERNHRQQRQARTLARRLSADGMATLRMYATAQDVAAVWDTCTLLADAAQIPGDDRDIGNRRVDALVDLLTGVLDTGRLDGCDTAGTAVSTATDEGDLGPADDTDDGQASSSVDDWLRWAAQFDHARALDAESARVAKAPEVEEATGFAPGAVAPFPLPKIDEALMERALYQHPLVWAGAGSSRHMLAISPSELGRLTRARPMDVVTDRTYDSSRPKES